MSATTMLEQAANLFIINLQPLVTTALNQTVCVNDELKQHHHLLRVSYTHKPSAALAKPQ